MQNFEYYEASLVTDKGLSKSDIVNNTLSILKSEGIRAELYSNVVGNPTGTNVNEVESSKTLAMVIAFGGGSGLDVGKAVAFMSGQTLPIWDSKMLGIIGLKLFRCNSTYYCSTNYCWHWFRDRKSISNFK